MKKKTCLNQNRSQKLDCLCVLGSSNTSDVLWFTMEELLTHKTSLSKLKQVICRSAGVPVLVCTGHLDILPLAGITMII